MNVLTAVKEKHTFETFAGEVVPKREKFSELNPSISYPVTDELSVRNLRYNKGVRQCVAA